MNKPSQYQQEWELWIQTMKESVEKWRRGDDQYGLNNFILAMQHFQHIIQQRIEQINEQTTKSFIRFLPHIQELHEQVQREDIIAITDTLEYKLIPFCEEMKERGDLK